MVRRVTHVFDGAVIEIRPHSTSGAQTSGLLQYLQVIGESFFHLVPLRITIGGLCVASRLRTLFGYEHHVGDPGSDRFDQYLRAFLFEERKHIEVAIALSGLGPELARDFDDRLYA